MTVRELIETMTKDFREGLVEIFIDNLVIEDLEDPTNEWLLDEEVRCWCTETFYTMGLKMKVCIYTKNFINRR